MAAAALVSAEPATLAIRPELAELARVSAWTAAQGAALGLSASTLFAIDLCLEEAVSNVIRHGYAAGADADAAIRLELARADADMVLTIEDHAPPFDPLSVAAPDKPQSVEDAIIGGHGVALMRRFARDLAYERRGGMNRLVVRIAVG